MCDGAPTGQRGNPRGNPRSNSVHSALSGAQSVVGKRKAADLFEMIKGQVRWA